MQTLSWCFTGQPAPEEELGPLKLCLSYNQYNLLSLNLDLGTERVITRCCHMTFKNLDSHQPAVLRNPFGLTILLHIFKNPLVIATTLCALHSVP